MCLLKALGKTISLAESQNKVGKNFTLSGNFNGYVQVSGPLCVKELTESASKTFRYRGQLKDTNIDGKGEFKWPDGRQYFGEFFQGAMNGKGKLTWTDKYNGKATYKGNFLVNQFHGPGVLMWSNGDIYDGKAKIDPFRTLSEWKLPWLWRILMG